MRVLDMEIKNFRVLSDWKMDVSSTYETGASDLKLILGDNGSGKTTVMQAIALVLGLATRQWQRAEEFVWPGFRLDRLSQNGDTKVSLTVLFDQDELDAVQEIHQHYLQFFPSENATKVQPSHHEKLTIVFRGAELSCDKGEAGLAQFHGRYFLKKLIAYRRAFMSYFNRLGDVFWFDQQRSMYHIRVNEREDSQVKLISTKDLRRFLGNWWGYHNRPDRKKESDYLEKLEFYLKQMIPGIEIEGNDPDGFFFFKKEGKLFEIEEMSSGESILLPFFYQFARLNIQKLIVLIDEAELHLHFSQQQKFALIIQELATENQFFISTHSEFFADSFADEDKIRMNEHGVCLI